MRTASGTAQLREADDAGTALDAQLEGAAFRDYVYGYPHKTTYRPLLPARDLADVWRGEPSDDGLQLYVHVPFCEMRCGFCNLFTATDPSRDLVAPYLTALRRQAEVTAEAIGPRRFTSFAIGGGTPTFLAADDLKQVFDTLEIVSGARRDGLPFSVEVSPLTATRDRLAVLKARGAERISIGVQSFVAAELKAYGRARDAGVAEEALAAIRDAGFGTLNIDLIYGGPRQTLESWLASLQQALEWQPEELYLYPLYVRPLTGLAGRADPEDALRLACYRAARERLDAAGYAQHSLRVFRRRDATGAMSAGTDDNMVGLGPGARSYTRALHYSSEYAVGRQGVLAILGDYAARDRAAFARADYGVALDDIEQRRRSMVLALMQATGLDRAAYRRRYGSDAVRDFPDLHALAERGLAHIDEQCVRLTDDGLERSDAIGPWLYSTAMRQRMEAYAWR